MDPAEELRPNKLSTSTLALRHLGCKSPFSALCSPPSSARPPRTPAIPATEFRDPGGCCAPKTGEQVCSYRAWDHFDKALFCRQEMEGRGDFGRRSVRAAPPTSAPTSVVRAGHVRGLLLLDPRHRQWKRQGVRPIGGGGGREGRNTGGAAGMLSAFAFSIGLNLLFQSYILHIQNVSCGRRDFRLRMSFFHSPRRWTTAPSPSSPATRA